jgi:hypothetical protein
MNAANNASSLIVTRDRGGWRDRARSYEVVIDGKKAANIKRGQRVELPIASGRHEVFVRINWGTSPSIQLDALPGESIQLLCTTGSSQLGSGYISLSRM